MNADYIEHINDFINAEIEHGIKRWIYAAGTTLEQNLLALVEKLEAENKVLKERIGRLDGGG